MVRLEASQFKSLSRLSNNNSTKNSNCFRALLYLERVCLYTTVWTIFRVTELASRGGNWYRCG